MRLVTILLLLLPEEGMCCSDHAWRFSTESWGQIGEPRKLDPETQVLAPCIPDLQHTAASLGLARGIHSLQLCYAFVTQGRHRSQLAGVFKYGDTCQMLETKLGLNGSHAQV